MKKIIALTAFVLLASAPAVQSAPAITQDQRATDFSSLKEVDPKPQDKKGKQSRTSKGGPLSEYEEIAIKEVDPAPQGKLKGMKVGKGKGAPSSGADEVGFNPQPDPPGIDKTSLKPTTRMDTPRFSVPSLGGAGGARVR